MPIQGKKSARVEPAQVDGVFQIADAGKPYWFAAVVDGGTQGIAQNAAACAKLTGNVTIIGDGCAGHGTKATSDTIVRITTAQMLYAHWKKR